MEIGWGGSLLSAQAKVEKHERRKGMSSREKDRDRAVGEGLGAGLFK